MMPKQRQPGPTLHVVPDGRRRPRPFDLDEFALAIETDASELFRRCVELNEIIEQAIDRWNPFADEADEDAHLDPGAEMVPYDALPDLEDLATRVAGLGVRLAVASALIGRVRRLHDEASRSSELDGPRRRSESGTDPMSRST